MDLLFHFSLLVKASSWNNWQHSNENRPLLYFPQLHFLCDEVVLIMFNIDNS